MSALAAAQPWDVASLGLRLLRASAAAAEARETAVAAPPAQWRGRAAEAFGARLGAVADRLASVERAYADGGRALLRYAAALEHCRDLALRAAALRTEADRLSVASTLPGPDPGHPLRVAADGWDAAAEEEHDAAARRAAAELRELVAAAPDARGGACRDRFRSDLGTALWGQVTGGAALLTTAGRALTGNRAARDELVAVARDAWRVWEPVVEVWQQLEDDRDGLAAAGVVGLFRAMGLGRTGALGTRSRVDDVAMARAEAVQEWRVRDLVSRLGVDAQPYQPGDRRIGLYAHEALNGHAVRQHVAKSLAYLRWRTDRTPARSASSFPDAVTAQRALDLVVAQHRATLDDFAHGRGPRSLTLDVDALTVVGHGYVRGDPDLRTSTVARAFFRRVDGGVVLVSFFPKVG